MLYNGLMKTLGKIFLIVLFAFLTPPFLFSVCLKLSGISPSYLKTRLVQGDIYKKVVQDINKGLEGPASGLTPAYLQKKSEKLIDDTDAWLGGTTKEAPVITLIDLDKNTLAQLEVLAKEMKKEQEKARQAGQESDMASFDLDKFVKSGFSYPIGEQMGFLKNLYFLATYGPLVFGLGMVLSFLGIILLSETMALRLRAAGFAFLGAGVWILPGWLVAFFGFKFLIQVLTENAKEIPTLILPLIDVITKPVISKYIQIGGIAMVMFFVGSIALFIFSRSYSASSSGGG